jgi:hypothetical protein
MRKSLLSLIGVFAGGLWSTGADAGEVQPDVMKANAITWLGESPTGEIAEEIKIMSLSCRRCLDELVDVLAGTQQAPGYLILNTTDATDFGIAWNWVTTVLAQPDAHSRRSTAIELLAIYVDSPEVYLAEPGLWRELCLARWSEKGADPSEPLWWAKGRNLLQQQNRLLGLLGRGTTPDTISLVDGGLPIPVGRSLSPDDQRMQIWENSEPALRPNMTAVATDRGDARPVLHRISLDPAMKLKASSWQKLRTQLKGGGLFEWEAGKGLDDALFQRWLAEMLSQPTMLTRAAAFERAFAAAETVAESKRRGTSLIYALDATMAKELREPIDQAFVQAAEFEVWAATVTN